MSNPEAVKEAKISTRTAPIDGVVSCPNCLRQYRIGVTESGRICRCAACRCHFVAILAEICEADEIAIVLDEDIAPHWQFFREGCGELARNAQAALRMAGEPVTQRSVLDMVGSLPIPGTDLGSEAWQRGAFHRTMIAAGNRASHVDDRDEFKILCDYFIKRFYGLRRESAEMLVAAFEGVLGNIDLDPDDGESEIETPWLIRAAIWISAILRAIHRVGKRNWFGKAAKK